MKEVLRLRKGRERRRVGLFVAEGPREVGRARDAGLAIRATFFAPSLLLWDEGEEVDERVLRKMSYRAEPEGVLAIVEIEMECLLQIAAGDERGSWGRTEDRSPVRPKAVSERTPMF